MTEKTTKTEKIVINGAPPKWNDVEFETRVDGWVKVYRGTTQCMEHVCSPLPHDFLELVTGKVSEGYTVARNHGVTSESLNHSCWMIKPEASQQKDIDDIRVRVKAEYVEFLQVEHVRYQDLLRQQLIQSAEEKEQKAIELARRKQLDAIEKQVQSCYKPLEIPE